MVNNCLLMQAGYIVIGAVVVGLVAVRLFDSYDRYHTNAQARAARKKFTLLVNKSSDVSRNKANAKGNSADERRR